MATFQLDDEPNLYIGHGWKSQFPSILNWLIGVPGMCLVGKSTIFYTP